MALVFGDTFNRADSSNLGLDWTEEVANAEIFGNEVRAAANNDAIIAYTGNMGVDDYIVKADLKVDAGDNNLRSGIIFRYSNSTAYYWVTYEPGGLVIPAKFLFYKHTASGDTLLGTFKDYRGSSFTVKIICSKNIFEVWVNNNARPILTIDDASYLSGKIGLRLKSTAVFARADNFTVDTIEGSPQMLRLQGNRIFNDDFNRADSSNLGASWTEAGDCEIYDNKLTTSIIGTGVNAIYAGSRETNDYAISSVFGVSALSASASSLVLRYVDNSNYYLAKILWSLGKIRLEKVVNGTPSTLAEIDRTLAVGTLYLLHFSAVGGQLKVWFQSEQSAAIVVEDASFATGSVGLRLTPLLAREYFADDFYLYDLSLSDFEIKDASAYRIEIYRGNEKRFVWSNSIGLNPVVSCEFELQMQGGCKGCVLKLAKNFTNKSQIQLHDTIKIYLFNNSKPIYTGFISERSLRSSTEDIVEIKADGFSAAFQTTIEENTTYTNAKIIDILDDFLEKSTAVAKKNINKIPDKVYDTQTINATFKSVSFDQIFTQLAMARGRYVWGVDGEGDFYFKAPIESNSPTILTLFAGKDIVDFKISERLKDVANKLYISYGTTGTTKYRLVENKLSQAHYGLRDKTVSAPSLTNSADVDLWGLSKLDETSNPIASASVDLVEPRFIEPYGNVRILSYKTKDISLDRLTHDIMVNSLDDLSLTDMTIGFDAGTRYQFGLLKFNSGNYTALRNFAIILRREKYDEEYDGTMKFEIWTDSSGVPGTPIIEQTPALVHAGKIADRQKFMIVGGLDLDATLTANTDYWLVCTTDGMYHGGYVYFGNNAVNSGIAQVYKRPTNGAWTALSNNTVSLMLSGEGIEKIGYMMNLKGVKYKIGESGIAVSLDLGNPKRTFEMIEMIRTKLKDIEALQMLWS